MKEHSPSNLFHITPFIVVAVKTSDFCLSLPFPPYAYVVFVGLYSNTIPLIADIAEKLYYYLIGWLSVHVSQFESQLLSVILTQSLPLPCIDLARISHLRSCFIRFSQT